MSSPRAAPAPATPPPAPAPGWPSSPVTGVAVTNVHDVQPPGPQPEHSASGEAGHRLPPPAQPLTSSPPHELAPPLAYWRVLVASHALVPLADFASYSASAVARFGLRPVALGPPVPSSPFPPLLPGPPRPPNTTLRRRAS